MTIGRPRVSTPGTTSGRATRAIPLPEYMMCIRMIEAGRTGWTIATDWGYRRAADPATTVPDNLGVA